MFFGRGVWGEGVNILKVSLPYFSGEGFGVKALYLPQLNVSG